MRLACNKSGLCELASSLTLISLMAIAPLVLPLIQPRPAQAQSSDFAAVPADADGAAPMPDGAASDDTAPVMDDMAPPSGDMARPAPSAHYAVPAEVSAGGDPSASADSSIPAERTASHSTASASDDRVLELPQIINPQVYAARAKAGIAEGTRLGNDYYPADQPADDSLTAAGDPSATAVAPWDPGDLAGNPSNDDQDYADQDDGGGTSGPVVVYAVPVYAPQPVYVPQFVPPVAVTANPLPQPYPAATIPRGQLPMYSALAYRPLPMYSGLRPVSPGRYATAGGGSRLMGSHFGQRFGIGSFSRGR